jgi:hypothetical protein
MVHPYEWFAFLCEIEKQLCEFRVVLDESSVEVTEAKEFLDIFNGLGLWPISDCFKLDRIYA